MADVWYRLNNFGCPVAGCPGRQGSYNWYCSVCKTSMWISQRGKIACQYDNHVDDIINWRFDCGHHGNHSARRFRSADYQGFSYALSVAALLMDRAGANWIASLVLALGRQYGRL